MKETKLVGHVARNGDERPLGRPDVDGRIILKRN
jgi:hypothetical protein